MPELVAPSREYRDSFLEAVREFPPDEETLAYERSLALRDFDAYVRTIEVWSRGEELPHGWVTATLYWLVENGEFVGTVNIRHELNDWLLRYGGHIGYAIRPTWRRRGYGTLICRLALEEARKLGLARVLITCDEDNVGSKLVIERNGGVFENAVPQPDRRARKRRYWIDLGLAQREVVDGAGQARDPS